MSRALLVSNQLYMKNEEASQNSKKTPEDDNDEKITKPIPR